MADQYSIREYRQIIQAEQVSCYSVSNDMQINGKKIREERGLDVKGESYMYTTVDIPPGKTITIETDGGR